MQAQEGEFPGSGLGFQLQGRGRPGEGGKCERGRDTLPGHLKTSPASEEARCLPRVPSGEGQTGGGQAHSRWAKVSRGATSPAPCELSTSLSRPALAPPSPARPPVSQDAHGLHLPGPSVAQLSHRLHLPGHPRGRTRTAFRSSKPRLCFAPLQVPPASRNAAAWSDPHLLKLKLHPAPGLTLACSTAQLSSGSRLCFPLFQLRPGRNQYHQRGG